MDVRQPHSPPKDSDARWATFFVDWFGRFGPKAVQLSDLASFAAARKSLPATMVGATEDEQRENLRDALIDRIDRPLYGYAVKHCVVIVDMFNLEVRP